VVCQKTCGFCKPALTVITSCDDTSNERKETLHTPNFPSVYGHNRHCTWKIVAPIGRLVKFDTFSYEIEGGSTCQYDALKIYDGSSADSNVIANLCGSNTENGLISTGRALFLEFDSDGSSDKSGFSIRYSLIELEKSFGPWNSDGDCDASGKTCGPGIQQQTRTCTNGTMDTCTESDRTRNISCNLADCEKDFGPWSNNGYCNASGKTCGPGTQQQTRTCTDGTTDTCTESDRTQSISCSKAGTELPNCQGNIFGCKEDKISLKSYHRKYVVAERDGSVNANRDDKGTWEVFTVERLGGNKIALKSWHNKYLVAENATRGYEVNANRNVRGPWEEFTVENKQNNTVALKTYHRRYLSAKKDGKLIADRTQAYTWETFQPECID